MLAADWGGFLILGLIIVFFVAGTIWLNKVANRVRPQKKSRDPD